MTLKNREERSFKSVWRTGRPSQNRISALVLYNTLSPEPDTQDFSEHLIGLKIIHFISIDGDIQSCICDFRSLKLTNISISQIIDFRIFCDLFHFVLIPSYFYNHKSIIIMLFYIIKAYLELSK